MDKTKYQSAAPISLLNRLMDAPTTPQQNQASDRQAFDALCKSLCRDLENLLNTRARCLSWPKECDELDRSLLAYGLPDFTALYLTSELNQQELCRWVEAVITNFEPRFKEVSVTPIVEKESDDIRVFRMRIEGVIYTQQMPQEITFESVIKPDTLTIMVREL